MHAARRGGRRGLQDRYVSVSLQAGRVNYIPGFPAPFLSFLRAPAHTPVQCAGESSSWRSVKRRWLRGRAVIGNRKAQPTRIQIIRPFIGTSCPSPRTRFRLIAIGRCRFGFLSAARKPSCALFSLAEVYFLPSGRTDKFARAHRGYTLYVYSRFNRVVKNNVATF